MNKKTIGVSILLLLLAVMTTLRENKNQELKKKISKTYGIKETASLEEMSDQIRAKTNNEMQQLIVKDKKESDYFAKYSEYSSEDLNSILSELQDEIENSNLIEIANSGEMGQADQKRLMGLLQKQNSINLVLIERELKEI